MRNKLRQQKKLVFLFLILGIGLGGTLLNPIFQAVGKHEVAAVSFPDPFLSLSLAAKTAIVYDPTREESVYEKDADRVLPLASLVKVITVITALGHASPEEEVVISAEALGESGEDGLYLGEKWDLETLAKFTLITSSNDGARAIAEAIEEKSGRTFEDLTQEKLRSLGVATTHVSNPTGLDIERRIGGGMGTARDMAKIFAHAVTLYPYIFSETAEASAVLTSKSGISHFVRNTNSAVLDTSRIIASKTGTTPLAGANLVIATDLEPGRPIVLVILGSTELERPLDMQKLLRSATKYFVSQTKIIHAQSI